jgi:hypothetical protein
MKLCEWCEALVDDESQELCHRCLDAQRRVESGNLIEPLPEKKKVELPQTIGRQVMNAFIYVGKGIVFIVFGWVMLLLGLLGTCLTLGAISSLVVAPLNAIGFLFAAVLAFAGVYGVYKLTNMMLSSPPRQIDRKHRPPPRIGRDE